MTEHTDEPEEIGMHLVAMPVFGAINISDPVNVNLHGYTSDQATKSKPQRKNISSSKSSCLILDASCAPVPP